MYGRSQGGQLAQSAQPTADECEEFNRRNRYRMQAARRAAERSGDAKLCSLAYEFDSRAALRQGKPRIGDIDYFQQQARRTLALPERVRQLRKGER